MQIPRSAINDKLAILIAGRSFASLRMTALGLFWDDRMLRCRSAAQHPIIQYIQSDYVIPNEVRDLLANGSRNLPTYGSRNLPANWPVELV